VAATTLVLDLSGVVTGLDGEGGLLGLALDPNYGENGYIYVNYTTGSSGAGTFRNHISRFTLDPESGGIGSLESEQMILVIAQPMWNHNGGGIAFGPDGFLYIGNGDGGWAGDPLGSGQDTSTLLGAMLRIDVSSLDDTGSYSIPEDNPFVGAPSEGAPEIYAWGLRNPWRFAFDPLVGTLYVADVGQDELEEINILVRGGNYGWNAMEGTSCYPLWSSCDPELFISPVAEYDHTVGLSVTGGEVVRSDLLPSLYGSYLYADYETNVLFAYPAPPGTGSDGQIGSTPGPVAGFGSDAEDNVFVLHHWAGQIYKVVESAAVEGAPEFPSLLSETGCFLSFSPLTGAPGVEPYSISLPFWSDGAEKQRFVHVPEGGTVTIGEDGVLNYPLGTVFMKHFEMAMEDGSQKRIETRLLLLAEEGAQGFTYEWREDGTDADLVTGSKDLSFDVAASSGATTWHVPSRTECRVCHTEATGGVLGADELGLLSGSGNSWGQLEAWAFLDASWSGGDIPHFPGLDTPEASVEQQARTYLEVNCAGCHRPGGPSGARRMDMRASTPLGEMGICNVAPMKSTLGLDPVSILFPGAPESSVLAERMKIHGEERMPPLGTLVVDKDGVGAVEAWIESLTGCPETP
jgi:uncharacterized repeat protein (TIGR03806 family)